jgi:hypothetical protein
MADEIDRANDRAQQFNEQSILAAIASAHPLQPIGTCYNCDDAVSEGLRFCDAECRDDWQRANPGK